MTAINTIETKEKTGLLERNLELSWKDSPPVQRLLDVISGIIASEYVQIAKQNPVVFLSDGTSR